jgi:hypothetical protein
LQRLRASLAPGTAEAWDALAPHLPASLYLGGGTAVAVHLRHRESADLDFFYHNSSVQLEDGIALFLERYELAPSSEALPHLISALGYLDDVEQDDSLSLNKRALARWWQERQPRLVRELSRRG